MTRTDLPRLLPARSEDLRGHLARFGSVPYRGTASALIPEIEASGLTGRGGTVRFVRSARRTFEPELARHERGHCLASTRQPFLPLPDAVPAHEDDWK